MTTPSPRDAAASTEAAPPQAQRAPRPLRLLDAATTVLLGVAAFGVFLAALPALHRALFSDPPRDDFGVAHADRHLPQRAPGEAPSHPAWVLDDEEDEEPQATELERLHPDGMWPGRRSPEERERERAIFGPQHDEQRDEQRDEAQAGQGGVTMGRVSRSLELVAHPGEDATTTGTLKAGDVVMILKEDNGWVLVVHSSDEGVEMGWTRKSEVAVR